mmetsp:Transcript_84552/g.244414  ORF Transcript_84552/g.244414 Transcript_84552/m.244414 type:complete len:228 (-) Transcript_84552:413-1096(-)
MIHCCCAPLTSLEGIRDVVLTVESADPVEEDYDPRNPQYVIPATAEQIAEQEILLLEAQIAKLEGHVASRPELCQASGFKIAAHYVTVAEEMRRRLAARRGAEADADMELAEPRQWSDTWHRARPRHELLPGAECMSQMSLSRNLSYDTSASMSSKVSCATYTSTGSTDLDQTEAELHGDLDVFTRASLKARRASRMDTMASSASGSRPTPSMVTWAEDRRCICEPL